MVRVLLDTMIYDILSKDSATCDRLRHLIKTGKVMVLATPTIERQLRDSPFNSIPDFFPVTYIRESVLVCGASGAGDRSGSGKVMLDHMGISKDQADAMIADVANNDADYLVTEDRDFLNRMSRTNASCIWLNYSDFSQWIKSKGTFNNDTG